MTGEFLSKWSAALVEAITALDKVILVAHSIGGMYALATEKLERLQIGLILMDGSVKRKYSNVLTFCSELKMPVITRG